MMASELQRKNIKACCDFVKKYDLVPSDYPMMMWDLEKNCLNYYFG
jgi:hypothetical protein